MISFQSRVQKDGLDLAPLSLDTLQLNITKLCNQACVHCHVDSSPRRRETMSDDVLEKCIEIVKEHREIENVDITGGAPELHPRFRDLVKEMRDLGKKVIVRHNLTVTLDPHPRTGESLEDLPVFFRDSGVEVVSSLPYHQEYFTDKQRGDGVFLKSIKSLKMLNEMGYGVPESGLKLNLVYNPVGAFLPASQESLEKDYKKELFNRFGIVFNHLFALTNMPIHRFKVQLVRSKNYEEYMQSLANAFNPLAAAGVMCRSMVSVSYDGRLYDCDFNQMLGMEIEGKTKAGPMTVFQFDRDFLRKRSIQFDSHCYGCTAGAGSSCGGKTSAT